MMFIIGRGSLLFVRLRNESRGAWSPIFRPLSETKITVGELFCVGAFNCRPSFFFNAWKQSRLRSRAPVTAQLGRHRYAKLAPPALCPVGDVIVYINDVCVLGTTHSDVVKLFQSVPIGQSVTLVLCRGYPLPYDPGEAGDAGNSATAAVSSLGVTEQRPLVANGRTGYENYLDYLSRTARLMADPSQDQMNAQTQLLPPHPGDTHLDGSLPPPAGATPPDSISMASSGTTQGELLTLTMVKGVDGFGFTIADSAMGQRVKQVLEPLGCPGLCEGDLIVEINKQPVHGFTHAQVVELLKDCGVGAETCLVVQRGGAGRDASKDPSPSAPYLLFQAVCLLICLISSSCLCGPVQRCRNLLCSPAASLNGCLKRGSSQMVLFLKKINK